MTLKQDPMILTVWLVRNHAPALPAQLMNNTAVVAKEGLMRLGFSSDEVGRCKLGVGAHSLTCAHTGTMGTFDLMPDGRATWT